MSAKHLFEWVASPCCHMPSRDKFLALRNVYNNWKESTDNIIYIIYIYKKIESLKVI